MINYGDLTNWNIVQKEHCSVAAKNTFKNVAGNIGFSLNIQDLIIGMEI